MSIKVYQSAVNQSKDIIDAEFGIIDETGIILACSNESRMGHKVEQIPDIIKSKDNVVELNGTIYEKMFRNNKFEFVTFIGSNTSNDYKYLSLISLNVMNMKINYDEKYDKLNFIRSIIMDNILTCDIQIRGKELYLANNVYRVVFLVKTFNTKDVNISEIIQGLFPNKTKDFIVVLDEENTVLVKELKELADIKEINNISNKIINTLNSDLTIKVTVGVGTLVDNIKDISRSFKEAQMALLIGGIFDNNLAVINYNNLGIGRLIYQLPVTLCRLFLQEVFKEGAFESFDDETLQTIQKFFENNLNVSETSRQLFVHRNTLVYRLDKIQKLTGLDLRMFDDAITFKVAMLVKRYLEKGDELYYSRS